MHDSGDRQQFTTGAMRDTAADKPRPDLMSPFMEERVGHWLRLGAEKYRERNWEQGMPFSRVLASLRRHVMKYQQGDRSEDHLSAIIFNAMALIHYEEMIAVACYRTSSTTCPTTTLQRTDELFGNSG